jgi:hypothetical protein
MKCYFLAIEHRNIIIEAMNTPMYVVGTPIPGDIARDRSFSFRPVEESDEDFVRFGYGDGCSSTIKHSRTILSSFEQDINIILQVGYVNET